MASLLQNSDDSNSLWGWFSSISDWFGTLAQGISSIWDSIISLPQNVSSAFSSFFSDIGTWFDTLWEGITEIPGKILDVIKSFFIPDTEDIKAQVTRLSDGFKDSFGVAVIDVSDSILGEEKRITERSDTKGEAIPDIEADTYLGFNIKGISFVNDEWLVKAADTFRPFIRGFIVLLMIFYNINQFLNFIGAGSLSSLGSSLMQHTPVQQTSYHHSESFNIDPYTGEVKSQSVSDGYTVSQRGR